MTDLQETIVALSSAAGPGARAIVRLSGADVLPAVSTCFVGPLERRRGRVEGEIRLPGLSSTLPADLYFWLGPKSYTGQDLAELHVLSSPPLIELLVARLLASGARAARAGELTMRGFLAGKLDLTRAEAVLGVIESGSRDELKQALAQLAGGIARPLELLRDDLLDLLADVEAGLDFSAEDIEFVDNEALLKRLASAMATMTLVAKQIDRRGLSERPFRVVLAGRPNAGKSSLFNALAGGRALVSPEAGTTRDYLVERLELHGVPLELVDTAGLRVESDAIERRAQALGRTQADEADLILLCLPAGMEPTSEESALTSRGSPPVLSIGTKADERKPAAGRPATSATTGEGIGPLRRLLADRARAWARPGLMSSLARCRAHVESSLDHLRRAHHGVLFGDPPEVSAMELRDALDGIGALVGTVWTDDLLDRIFSRFCIGK